MDLIEILKYALLLYVVIALVIYFFQEQLIFKPEKLAQDFKFNYPFPFEEQFYETAPGVSIHALYFFAKNSKGVVFYFHGNRRSIKGYGKNAVDFTENGFDVLMISYRGFGKSTGKRSEKGILQDAQYIYKELLKKWNEDQIIIYGRSMGSGFATKIAALNKPKYLILDSPYYSFISVANRYTRLFPLRYLLRYPLRTYRWIRKVKSPIYIIHGTKDNLIPYRSSVRLKRLVKKNSMLLSIRGGGHNDLRNFKEYHLKLSKILKDEFPIGKLKMVVGTSIYDDSKVFHFE